MTKNYFSILKPIQKPTEMKLNVGNSIKKHRKHCGKGEAFSPSPKMFLELFSVMVIKTKKF